MLFLLASYFIPGNVAVQVLWRYSHFGGNIFINHACPNKIKYFVMQFPPRVYSTHFKWLILWIFFKLPELVVISFIVLLNNRARLYCWRGGCLLWLYAVRRDVVSTKNALRPKNGQKTTPSCLCNLKQSKQFRNL